MQTSKIENISLLSLTGGVFMQLGGQLFAIVVVVGTLVKSPPESLAMLNGPYAYDSSVFWNFIPNVNFLLFILATLFNWKNKHRNWILAAFAFYFISGLCSIFISGPLFTQLTSGAVSEGINALATQWHVTDWLIWLLGLISGLLLTIRLYSVMSSK
jgi:hypothetical protein